MVFVRMERAYLFSVMGIGQVGDVMLGICSSGLLVGLFSRGTLTNRGERMGCLENVSRLDRSLSRSLTLWNLGASFIKVQLLSQLFSGSMIVL